MLRRSYILTSAVILAVCALPATAAAQQDLRMPDTRDAAAASRDGYQDLRSPDAKDAAREAGAVQSSQDLRSADAVDAAAHRGLYGAGDGTYALNRDYGSPDAADAARDLPPVQIPAPVVEIREAPSGGFDWGDAGIGAAGMLALFSIGAGSALLITGRRRRRGFQVATH